jgi:hypothetical protein
MESVQIAFESFGEGFESFYNCRINIKAFQTKCHATKGKVCFQVSMLKWKCQKYESKHCQSKSSKETENAYW